MQEYHNHDRITQAWIYLEEVNEEKYSSSLSRSWLFDVCFAGRKCCTPKWSISVHIHICQKRSRSIGEHPLRDTQKKVHERVTSLRIFVKR